MAITKDFQKTFDDIERLSGSKKERARRLAEKAQFMHKQIMKLQRTLAKKGWVEEYQNGANQSGQKKSSEADVYLGLTKNFLAIMKQLEEMLATVPLPEEESKLAAFLNE